MEKCEEGIKEIYKHIRDDDHENRIECNLLEYRVNLIKDIQNEAEDILIDTYKYAINNDCNKRAGQIAIMLGKFYMDSKREKEAAKYLDYGIDIFNSIGLLRN